MEIYWDAVVAFVKNPGLPPTNNDAQPALRHAVISRRISFDARATEGSRAYTALLSHAGCAIKIPGSISLKR